MILIWFLLQLCSSLIDNIWKRVMVISKIHLSITRWHMKTNTTISISMSRKITEMLTCFLVQAMEIQTPWTEAPSSNCSCFHPHLKVTMKKRSTSELTIKNTSIMISKLNTKSFSKKIQRKEKVHWKDLQCLPSPSPRQSHQLCLTRMTQAPKSTIQSSTSNPNKFIILLTIGLITLQYRCRAHSLITIKMEAPLVTVRLARRRRTF